MKSSSLPSLGLASVLTLSGVGGCETKPVGQQVELKDPSANSQLATARKTLESCLETDEQTSRELCLQTAVTLKNRALISAGLSAETETAEVVCSGYEPCSIKYKVTPELCRKDNCKITNLNEQAN